MRIKIILFLAACAVLAVAAQDPDGGIDYDAEVDYDEDDDLTPMLARRQLHIPIPHPAKKPPSHEKSAIPLGVPPGGFGVGGNIGSGGHKGGHAHHGGSGKGGNEGPGKAAGHRNVRRVAGDTIARPSAGAGHSGHKTGGGQKHQHQNKGHSNGHQSDSSHQGDGDGDPAVPESALHNLFSALGVKHMPRAAAHTGGSGKTAGGGGSGRGGGQHHQKGIGEQRSGNFAAPGGREAAHHGSSGSGGSGVREMVKGKGGAGTKHGSGNHQGSGGHDSNKNTGVEGTGGNEDKITGVGAPGGAGHEGTPGGPGHEGTIGIDTGNLPVDNSLPKHSQKSPSLKDVAASFHKAEEEGGRNTQVPQPGVFEPLQQEGGGGERFQINTAPGILMPSGASMASKIKGQFGAHTARTSTHIGDI